MADYKILVSGFDLFELVIGTPLAEAMVEISANKCRLRNWDGSCTQLLGSGLVWDSEAKAFTAGTIEAMSHVAGGRTLDVVTGLALPASDVQRAMEAPGDSSEALRELVFAGNDIIDLTH